MRHTRAAGQLKCLYRAVDQLGQTVDFLLTARCDLAAVWRFIKRILNVRDVPEKITIDKSEANPATVHALVTDSGLDIELRQSKYVNNLIEQGHRAISVERGRWRPSAFFPLRQAHCWH